MRKGHLTRRHRHDHDAWVVMPSAVAKRGDDDLLDADVGRTLSLELDSVAIQVDRAVEVRRDEVLRRESGPGRSESHSRERSNHRDSGCRGSPLLRTQYAQDFPLSSTDPPAVLRAFSRSWHLVTSVSKR